jgi:LacI family transcriptional regulator
MAKRIDQAIADLGYRPNVMARRLSRGASEIIGFVTSDIASPFFAAIASAAEEEAERHCHINRFYCSLLASPLDSYSINSMA